MAQEQKGFKLEPKKCFTLYGRDGKTSYEVPLLQNWSLDTLATLSSLADLSDAEDTKAAVEMVGALREALYGIVPGIENEDLADVEIIRLIQSLEKASDITLGE